MKKVIFVYEQHQDPSAAQALKELLGKINGNVSLCLEMPEQNIKATLAAVGNQSGRIVNEIKALRNASLSKKVEYLTEFFKINKEKYVLNIEGVKSVKELSLPQAKKCLQNITEDQKGIYDSISATLDSVRLAETKGMKVYAIDQPYSERSDVGPLSYDPRDRYIADKLTALCNETAGVMLFLVEYDSYPIAEIVRANGILAAEYYIRTNMNDQSDLCVPSSVRPMVIGSHQDLVEVVSHLVEEVAPIKVEESKQDPDHLVPLYTISAESTKSTTEAVSTVMPNLASSPPTDMTAIAHKYCSSITTPNIVNTLALCATAAALTAAITTGEPPVIGKMLIDLIGDTLL